MAVELLDNDAFYGYRVRRTINRKLYQKYFSLKKDGKRLGSRQKKRIEEKALQRDEELIEERKKVKQKLKAQRCFNADGTVKGVNYLIKRERSGNVTPTFQMGIASELEKRVVCTSFSINAHGKENAWRRVIETYAKHKLVGKSTKLYKKLIKAMPQNIP